MPVVCNQYKQGIIKPWLLLCFAHIITNAGVGVISRTFKHLRQRSTSKMSCNRQFKRLMVSKREYSRKEGLLLVIHVFQLASQYHFIISPPFGVHVFFTKA